MAPQAQDFGDFENLNRRFRPALMAYFLRRLHNHADAEDLTQAVFVRLAALPPKELQSPEAYVFQIAANLLKDRFRRDRVRADYSASLNAVEGRGIDPIDPLRIVSGREDLAKLREGLAALPERVRATFLLSRLENVERRTLAETYGVSISTIDRDLAKALAALTRKILGEQTP
ncbi:RNA polymerase sigma factor [Sphingosinicella rhizophila]|uniref:Sigma-70 family RNA polymerase sigma factor n=1 Tax=Sphingosinicella rhizophila TaxID=3050082 RepID=A0ABU3Q9X0_9SPHN|nr:sigma-70 family RNA polymerase sigma factor [Sphingosinicella sp. GR2756]MDT9600194.1 sigma-70 family RNA polymerase sigma factor [Sphingosinicella sp. GR2756]